MLTGEREAGATSSFKNYGLAQTAVGGRRSPVSPVRGRDRPWLSSSLPRPPPSLLPQCRLVASLESRERGRLSVCVASGGGRLLQRGHASSTLSGHPQLRKVASSRWRQVGDGNPDLTSKRATAQLGSICCHRTIPLFKGLCLGTFSLLRSPKPHLSIAPV